MAWGSGEVARNIRTGISWRGGLRLDLSGMENGSLVHGMVEEIKR